MFKGKTPEGAGSNSAHNAASRNICETVMDQIGAKPEPGGCQMKRTLTLGLGAVLSLAVAAPLAGACSRDVYFGLEGQTVTGCTMDWFISDMDTNMWLYPRGLERV
jgi:hypothetical protein